MFFVEDEAQQQNNSLEPVVTNITWDQQTGLFTVVGNNFDQAFPNTYGEFIQITCGQINGYAGYGVTGYYVNSQLITGTFTVNDFINNGFDVNYSIYASLAGAGSNPQYALKILHDPDCFIVGSPTEMPPSLNNEITSVTAIRNSSTSIQLHITGNISQLGGIGLYNRNGFYSGWIELVDTNQNDPQLINIEHIDSNTALITLYNGSFPTYNSQYELSNWNFIGVDFWDLNYNVNGDYATVSIL